MNKINTFLLILLLSISSKQISAHQITNAEVGFNPFAPQIYITYYNEWQYNTETYFENLISFDLRRSILQILPIPINNRVLCLRR